MAGSASLPAMEPQASMPDVLSLADWRRRVIELYAAVRGNPNPAAAWADWVVARERLLQTHPQSPLGAVGIRARARRRAPAERYFPYDATLRFVVPTQPPADDAPIELQLGPDGATRLTPVARTDGLTPSLGGELPLYWIGGYGGGVLLPFVDATSGEGTFAGGRYLLDTIKGADLGMAGERIVLDFNFAYNPSCAYDPRWVCPLAPPRSRLSVPIEAGERIPPAP